MTESSDDRDPVAASPPAEVRTESQRLADELERATQRIRLRAWPPAEIRPAA
ncbi:MAG: hypothetical protein HKO59_09295 [Phycisphaerales bacterium]|nr:hypothetical protein [Phycisphaerae bacterium]NNF42403.1 hypothetical protein [Phycisphaerales bacterium]NNM26164.1 hypothetical protein [Phycisphaerales bacterium]